MPDNWGYVAAAYVSAALMLGAYWRHLVRRAADLARPRPARRPRRDAKSWPVSDVPPTRP